MRESCNCTHTQTKQKQWFLYENGGFIWNNSFYESSQFELKENADTTFAHIIKQPSLF